MTVTLSLSPLQTASHRARRHTVGRRPTSRGEYCKANVNITRKAFISLSHCPSVPLPEDSQKST